MRKMIIGIVPGVRKNIDNPYEYKYIYLNSYSKMINDVKGIPFGLLPSDEVISIEQLNMCDGFIFPGGRSLERFHFDIILHALKYNKPILGICLGMQVLNYFSILKDILTNRNMNINSENLWKIFNEVQDKDIFKLKDIPTPNIHGYQIMKNEVECNLDTLAKSKHDISINKDSILYTIYNTSLINVLSLHLKQVTNVGSDFHVSAVSPDNIIEALEYKDNNYFIIGVQYHPELDDKVLFKRFISEVNKRV